MTTYTTASGGLTTNPAKAVSTSTKITTSSGKTISSSSLNNASYYDPISGEGYYKNTSGDVIQVSGRSLQPVATLTNGQVGYGGVGEATQTIVQSSESNSSQSQPVLTDVKAGSSVYNKTSSAELSKFVGSQGREGLPLFVNYGNVGYKGKTYQSFDYNGKTYEVAGQRLLSESEVANIKRQIPSASKSYLASLGVVDVSGSGNPYKNTSQYGTELKYENGLGSGVFAKDQDLTKNTSNSGVSEIPFTPASNTFVGGFSSVNGGYGFGMVTFNNNTSLPNQNGTNSRAMGKNIGLYNDDNNTSFLYNSSDNSGLQEKQTRSFFQKTIGFFKGASQVVISPVVGGVEEVGQGLNFGLGTISDFSKGFTNKFILGKSDGFSEFNSNIKEGKYNPKVTDNMIAFRSVIAFAPISEFKIVKLAYAGYVGYEATQVAKNPTPENLGSLTVMATPLIFSGYKFGKESVELAKGTWTPEPVGRITNKEIFIEQDTNINTQARTFDNLGTYQPSKITMTYDQKFRLPFNLNEARVPVKTEIFSDYTKTTFELQGINYEYTKFNSLESTGVTKTYSTTPVPFREMTTFQKTFPEMGSIEFNIMNRKQTPTNSIMFKPDESSIVQFKGKTEVFDIIGKQNGRRIMGFGKSDFLVGSKSTADYSKKFYSANYIEQTKGNYFGSSKPPILESGKIMDISSSVKVNEISPTIKSIIVEKTQLELGKPDYSRDIKTKNLDRKLIDSGKEFNLYKVKQRTIKKGQVISDVSIKGKTIIKLTTIGKKEQFIGSEIYGGEKPYQIKSKSSPLVKKIDFQTAEAGLFENLKREGISFEFNNLAEKKAFVEKLDIGGKKQGLSKVQVENERATMRSSQIQKIAPLNVNTQTIITQSKTPILTAIPKKTQTPKILFINTKSKNQNNNSISKQVNNNVILSSSINKIVNSQNNILNNQNKNIMKNNIINRSVNKSENKNIIRNETKNELKQNLKQSITQELKQEQRQQIKNKLVPINKLTPSINNPKNRISINPSIYKSGSKSISKSFSTRPVKQSKGYTPSLVAVSFNIRGKSSKFGNISGLGIRPIGGK